MRMALGSDELIEVSKLLLMAWIATLVAVVLIILPIARWALARASSDSVANVLAGLALLLGKMSWIKDLCRLILELARSKVASASTLNPGGANDTVEIESSSDGLGGGSQDHTEGDLR
jgi:hypothetical protein